MARHGTVRVGDHGARMTHRLDPEIYFAAVKMGRETMGVDNVFNEPEFVADCERHHGWFKTREIGGKVQLFTSDRRITLAHRNRFGRVKETIRYGKDGERMVVRHV